MTTPVLVPVQKYPARSRRTAPKDFIGDSAWAAQVRRLIPRLAASRSPILLLGETGSGKDVLARAVYGANPAGPFIVIDCSTLVSSLVESELFGYARGAFTGAGPDKPGLIAMADGGTAFFDEIGELSLEMQAKLLRVLQEKEYRPVGSLTTRTADFRVIAASNRDLNREVDAGRFRRDLLYRLNSITIRIPPLRERREDIPVLARHFLDRRDSHCALTAEINAAMSAYDWPGNVRELENAIQCMLDLGDTGTWWGPWNCTVTPPAEVPPGFETLSVAEAERRTILEAMRRTNGNKQHAARLLGMGRTTLYRKLQEIEGSL